jgi:hypothetical protein
MVRSVIDSTYQYPEHTNLSPQDIGVDLDVYTVELHDMCIDVMLGTCDAETIPGINTYPIYVMRDKSYERIGLFEVSAVLSRTILDDTGSVDLSRLGNPLLFHNAKRVIRESQPIRVKRNQTTAPETPNHTKTNYTFHIDTKRFKTNLARIPIQNSKLCQREKWNTHPTHSRSNRESNNKTKKRAKSFKGNWVGNVLNSTAIHLSPPDTSNVDILDCLLVALNTVSTKPINPVACRISLGEYIGPDNATMSEMISIYKSYISHVREMKRHMSELTDENKRLRETSTEDMIEAQRLIAQGAANKSSYVSLKRGVELLDRFAARTGICDMANADNVDMVDMISSGTVPMNIPFLSLMETYFHIRVICFVSCKYSSGGYWVHITPEPLSHSSHPDTPIICVAMHDSTCQLIQYKGNTVFTHDTLPWRIKCIAAKNTPVIDSMSDSLSQFSLSTTQYVCSSKIGDEIPGFGAGEYVDVGSYVDASNDSIRENLLYIPAAHATHATHATHAIPDLISYISLYRESEWRAMLSDEWMCDIVHDGFIWGSAVHYLAAVPYKAYPDYYGVFSKQSRSDVSRDVRLIPKHVASIPKKNRGTEATSKERFAIYEAKFTQHPILRTILKMTGNSILMRVVGGTDTPSRLVPNIELMKFRET